MAKLALKRAQPTTATALRQEYAQTTLEQAEALGLDMGGWSRLALCRMPACALDLATIAEAFGRDAEKLAELLQLDLLP